MQSDLWALAAGPIRRGERVTVTGRDGEWRVVSRAEHSALVERVDTGERERVPVAMIAREAPRTATE